jgi:hypothetical protein
MTTQPWWNIREPKARALAKAKSDHSDDDATVLAMFPRMKRVKPTRPKPETIDKFRERLFRMAAELEQHFKDRLRREDNGNNSRP